MKNPMSPDFQQQGTTSLDLPPAIASILNMGSQAPITPNMPQAGLSSAMLPQQGFIPSYQQGGLVAPTGAPQQMPADMAPAQGVGVSQNMQPSAPIDPQMLEMQLNQFVRQNPQQMQQIQQVIMEEVQSGELTADELNMMIQLATVAAQNPQMYPNVRRFAIQQGIATEQDLPMEYDQGLVFVLLLAARAVQNMTGGGQQIQSMKMGGKVSGDGGAVLINAHAGEYVIPKQVVEKKGTEFFDKMIGKDSGTSKS